MSTTWLVTACSGGGLRLPPRKMTLLSVGGGGGLDMARRMTLLPVGGGGLGMVPPRSTSFFLVGSGGGLGMARRMTWLLVDGGGRCALAPRYEPSSRLLVAAVGCASARKTTFFPGFVARPAPDPRRVRIC